MTSIELVDVFMGDKGSTNYAVVFEAEIIKTLPIIFAHTTAMAPYSSVAVVVIGSDLGIHVAYNQPSLIDCILNQSIDAH